MRTILLLSCAALVAVVAIGFGISITAANTVPATRATLDVVTITADTLKPASCAALTLTAKLTGAGAINGTAAAELITGGPAGQTITGGGGNDCILGGGGNDAIDCGAGIDVGIGGAGLDTNTGGRCETFVQ